MSDGSTEHDEADLTRDRALSDTAIRSLDNSKAVLSEIDREATRWQYFVSDDAQEVPADD
jgi:hypothetical protein